MSSSISSCRCSGVQSDSENIDNNVSLFMPFGQLSYNESSVPLATENKKHSMAMVWFSVSLSLSVIVSALHVGDVTKKIFHSCRLPIVGADDIPGIRCLTGSVVDGDTIVSEPKLPFVVFYILQPQ